MSAESSNRERLAKGSFRLSSDGPGLKADHLQRKSVPLLPESAFPDETPTFQTHSIEAALFSSLLCSGIIGKK